MVERDGETKKEKLKCHNMNVAKQQGGQRRTAATYRQCHVVKKDIERKARRRLSGWMARDRSNEQPKKGRGSCLAAWKKGKGHARSIDLQHFICSCH
mmetsp:Transcript_32248/g.64002  ORF Transcript_32248/g.64002 Transcript_32248/m.64002 type:complete len:97 (-) Transcript_32248:725-1015(-)